MGMGVETRGRTQDGCGDGSGDGSKSCSGDGNGDEDGNEDGNRDKGGVEREPRNLRNGNSDGSEDPREEATPTSNEQPKSQDPTPQRNRRNGSKPRNWKRGTGLVVWRRYEEAQGTPGEL